MPAHPDRSTVTVRVTPNAKKSEITGWTTDEKGRPVLQVRLAAPPVEGKANSELLWFLSATLGCGKGSVSLLRGNGSRLKTVEIPAECQAKLPARPSA